MKLYKAALLLTALVVACGSKTTNAATIQIDPTTQSALLGQSISANVSALGFGNGVAPSIGAYDLNIAFDPSLLSFVNASFGTGLDVRGLGSIQSVTPGSGTVELFELSLDSTADLNSLQPDTFNLAKVTFQTIGLGTSPLSLSANAISDADGNNLPATLTGGSVQIVDVIAPEIDPASSAGALALLAGVLLIVRGRRKNGLQSAASIPCQK